MTTTSTTRNSAGLIAPCGLNCRLCQAYGRARNPCAGCRATDSFRTAGMCSCSVRCENLASGEIRYCFECGEFPCARLKHLDKRYRTRYATSPIDNLLRIQAGGIRRFIRDENVKWACPQCGALLCMHKPECGHRWRAPE